MKILFLIFTCLGVVLFSSPVQAKTDVRKSIIGNDPKFDATISRSPLNEFIKDIYRPEETSQGESPYEVPYEEAVPSYNNYYPEEGRYYQETTPLEKPVEQDKSYYPGKGRYYLPPEE